MNHLYGNGLANFKFDVKVLSISPHVIGAGILPLNSFPSPCEMLFNKGPLAVPRGRCLCVLKRRPSRFHSQKNETAHSLLTHTDLNSCLAIPLLPLLSSLHCVTAGVVDHRSALVKTRPSRALKGASALLAFASIFHPPRPTSFLVPYLP